MTTMRIEEFWRADGMRKATIAYPNAGGWQTAEEGRRGLLERWKRTATLLPDGGIEVPDRLIIQRIYFDEP